MGFFLLSVIFLGFYFSSGMVVKVIYIQIKKVVWRWWREVGGNIFNKIIKHCSGHVTEHIGT